ncbi:carbohydrate ABC transporter permease [Acetivibrio cellulolyticus]|uniref:carbohydrate ABC transporter permease n=1 Tax=Acetivibrio cellulolyticus TaxID=35830 RepID=UPI0001E2EC31|nr:carbohydrate ABC transporter permease [Acetivibrio cellulolyticus]
MVKEEMCKTNDSLSDKIADRILILFIAISIIPIITLLNASFNYIITDNFRMPQFVRQQGFMSYLKNSIFLSSMSIILGLAIALPAAYALARYKFTGLNMFSIFVVFPLLIPTIAYFLPFAVSIKRIQDISGIKFYNTYNGYYILAIMYAVMYLPFSIWMLRGFIVSIPVEIEEAARVDGCSTFGIMARILLPLISSGIVVTAMLLLMLVWDERLLVDVLMTSDNMKTVALWPSYDNNRFFAAPLSSIPIFAIFFVVQKNFMKGLTGGALKE